MKRTLSTYRMSIGEHAEEEKSLIGRSIYSLKILMLGYVECKRCGYGIFFLRRTCPRCLVPRRTYLFAVGLLAAAVLIALGIAKVATNYFEQH